MKFIKLSMQYIKKNFVYVFLMAFIPGILLSLSTEPSSVMHFFGKFRFSEVLSFSDIFFSVSEISWKSFIFVFAILPVVVFFISALCGYESKHMRLGTLKYNSFFRGVNNNILTVFKVCVVFLIVLEFYALLLTVLTFTWIKVFKSHFIAAIFSIATNFILLLTVLYLFSLFIIWMPTMSITGLSMSKAFAESFSHVKGNIFKLFVAVLFPLIICYGITYPLAYFNIRFRMLYNIPIFIFMIMYYVTLMYTSYCEIMDIDREDLKDNYIPKGGKII